MVIFAKRPVFDARNCITLTSAEIRFGVAPELQ
jgi:hypothetical protein